MPSTNVGGTQNGDAKKNIVIIGGGIIGCTTAYYLTRHPSFSPETHDITLVESSKIAGGASGKAGGLLALWARIQCGQLDAKGRPLLRKQAQANGQDKKQNGDSSISLEKRDNAALGKLRAAGFPKDLDWVDSDCAISYDEMGDPNTTAQVDPYQFTNMMSTLASHAGVKILEDTHVESINRTEDGTMIKSVTATQKGGAETITHHFPATSVVLAAGPWTSRLLSSAPIQGLRAHSVVIRPSRPVSGYALFTSINLPSDFGKTGESRKAMHSASQTVTPEIYARPHDRVYACGEGDRTVPLPDATTDVEVDPTRCQDVVDYVGSISDELRDGTVMTRQACYLPVAKGSGGPWIGEVPECKGLILASGHSCWGIQNGPGTGKLVSEIIMEGKAKSAKLGNLDPKKSL
ncbi:MAG: hypothetical protein M1828_007367 [Chrysothrix sp. TS-e1954]|nr:MAG: hypothetical protein M1828_007367 [Chrysothrix sp. TS-e1954]